MVWGVGVAPAVIMTVLTLAVHREGPRPMPSSPSFTLVDQFDEDEFPDIPRAPADLLAALPASRTPGRRRVDAILCHRSWPSPRAPWWPARSRWSPSPNGPSLPPRRRWPGSECAVIRLANPRSDAHCNACTLMAWTSSWAPGRRSRTTPRGGGSSRSTENRSAARSAHQGRADICWPLWVTVPAWSWDRSMSMLRPTRCQCCQSFWRTSTLLVRSSPPTRCTVCATTPPTWWSGTRTICSCLLYTSDAADEEDSVDLGGRRIIKKKKKHKKF